MNTLEQKLGVIDLNRKLLYSNDSNKGVINEYRQNCFFSDHGISSITSISKMCKKIQRRLQSAKFYMHGSILMYGLCPTHISRKFARYRSLFTLNARQTLSHGYSRQSKPNNFSQSQRKSRLAYLRRFCTSVNSFCQKLIRKRRFWFKARRNFLRFRRNNNRSMPIFIPLGKIQNNQGRNQVAHASRFARLYPDLRRITHAKFNEKNILDILIPEPGSFYILDRGYFHYQRLYYLHQSKAYFVIRALRGLRYRRIYSHKINKSLGLRYDQTIIITAAHVAKDYPEKIRRIVFFDQENQNRLVPFFLIEKNFFNLEIMNRGTITMM